MTTFDQLFGDDSGPLSQPFEPEPVVLEGSAVRLEPLSLDHAEDLWDAGKVDTLWRYMSIRPPRSLEDTRRWIGDAIEEMEAGRDLSPFERLGGVDGSGLLPKPSACHLAYLIHL